jgi:catechol 2,3-dioxygenase-like lactoylglutathione lyase family enzyme
MVPFACMGELLVSANQKIISGGSAPESQRSMKAGQRPQPVIDGWREALLSVADFEGWKSFYTQLDGWELMHEGDMPPDMLSYLQLPEGSKAREALLGKSNSTCGFVRLVSFVDADRQPLIRSNAQPWETGGWFDLNSRVEDLESCFVQLQNLGWTGRSDPIRWDFGPLTVREWLAFGPDGITLALIERIEPPLAAALQPGAWGAHFNSTQFVDDIESARRFYEDLLGFNVVVEVDDQPVASTPAGNVLGLPSELAATQHWNIAMLSAPGADGGSVEVVSLPGLSGRNFADQANPPHRGIVSLRFPVNDVVMLHQKLCAADVTIIQTPRTLELAHVGRVKMMTAIGPCGARLDFFQEK